MLIESQSMKSILDLAINLGIEPLVVVNRRWQVKMFLDPWVERDSERALRGSQLWSRRLVGKKILFTNSVPNPDCCDRNESSQPMLRGGSAAH